MADTDWNLHSKQLVTPTDEDRMLLEPSDETAKAVEVGGFRTWLMNTALFSTLTTTAKNIIGAIEEVKGIADLNTTQLNENAKDITEYFKQKETLNYYVDYVNGSDDNDGLTTSTAFKTIEKAWNSIPVVVNAAYKITLLSDYSADINIGNKLLISSMNIDFNSKNLSGTIVEGLCKGSGGLGLYNINSCPEIAISNSNAYIFNCKTNRLTLTNGYEIIESSTITANESNYGIVGKVNNFCLLKTSIVNGSYGIHAEDGARIIKNAFTNNATTTKEEILRGGEIS